MFFIWDATEFEPQVNLNFFKLHYVFNKCIKKSSNVSRNSSTFKLKNLSNVKSVSFLHSSLKTDFHFRKPPCLVITNLVLARL